MTGMGTQVALLYICIDVEYLESSSTSSAAPSVGGIACWQQCSIASHHTSRKGTFKHVSDRAGPLRGPARPPQPCSLQYRYPYSRPRSPSRPNSCETTQPGPTDPSQCPEADSAHEGCQGDQSRTDLVERRGVVLKVIRQLFAGQIANQLSGHRAQVNTTPCN